MHDLTCCRSLRLPHFGDLWTSFIAALLRRSAIAEAAANATLPGADLATITSELDAYYRMILHSFPRPAEYQQLYWSMIGYVPTRGPAGSKDAASPGGGGVHWKAGFTAGGMHLVSPETRTCASRVCRVENLSCVYIIVHDGSQRLVTAASAFSRQHTSCVQHELTVFFDR
jgi:hypothetical protein